MGESEEGAEKNLKEAKVMCDLNIWSYDAFGFGLYLPLMITMENANTQKFDGNSPTLFSNPFARLSQLLDLFIQFWKLSSVVFLYVVSH